jgi:acetolactate synthase-1/2/3 large subunit
MRYADVLATWLEELGYTHCFFVAGGGIMHLLDAVRTRMNCIPVVHEVAAGIATEYFNEVSPSSLAFALVTAGPGVTNILTAMAGAYLESRQLLVLAGQVKSADLATGGVRQRGIQEVDGRALAAPVSVRSIRVERPIDRRSFCEPILEGRSGRPGPVFVEVCLDAQGTAVDSAELNGAAIAADFGLNAAAIAVAGAHVEIVAEKTRSAKRPIWLVGGGVSRATAARSLPDLRAAGVPLMTTWNGADRIPRTEPSYIGRPNTWGQRSANVLLRQADLIVAFGTRLGLQQTGFNWQEFGADAELVQIDIDPAELAKGHPRVDLPIAGDANELLRRAAQRRYPSYGEWIEFCLHVRHLLPLDDPANKTSAGFISPFRFYQRLSEITAEGDIIVPCSSGGANSTAMQAFEPLPGQIMIVDKGLASMGYGLSGAIGAAVAQPGRRIVLVEGDGGFVQNLQELATVDVNALNIKIFIFANEGYASIRTTQRNYFNGSYLGCDTKTGLGFPHWDRLFSAFDIPMMSLREGWSDDPAFLTRFSSADAHAFVVPVDPEQTYFPKIASRVLSNGSMESNPLHLMSPELPTEIAHDVFRYLGGADGILRPNH